MVLERNDDVTIIECCQAITTDVLLKYIKEIKGIKILHAHGLAGLSCKVFENKGNIKNTIGNTYNYFFWKIYYKFYLPKYINDFDTVINLSQYDSGEKYIRNHFKKEKFILGNATDNIFFEKDKKNNIKKYCSTNGNYFISIANYSPVKNQNQILKEFYKSNYGQKYDMIFIGKEKNNYYNRLIEYNKKLEKKYGKRNVYFLTNLNRNELPGILSGAKMYLAGSTHEEYSLSLIEAMTQGIPFVSTDVGNAKELPGGISIKNIKEMNIYIDKLMSNKKIYNNLSENGKKYASENCKITCKIDELIKILKEMKASTNQK